MQFVRAVRDGEAQGASRGRAQARTYRLPYL